MKSARGSSQLTCSRDGNLTVVRGVDSLPCVRNTSPGPPLEEINPFVSEFPNVRSETSSLSNSLGRLDEPTGRSTNGSCLERKTFSQKIVTSSEQYAEQTGDFGSETFGVDSSPN